MINYILAKERIAHLNKQVIHYGYQFDLDTFDILSSRHDLTGVLFYDDSYYNHKNNLLVLVLIRDGMCVSTITCNIRDSCISISSKTKSEHTGNKYNLLLHAILITICWSIRENEQRVSMIKSHAINVASEALLRKYFDVIAKPDYVFHIVCDANNTKKAKTVFDIIINAKCR